MSETIVLIGCGNMGYAMLQGWLDKMPDLDAHVVEPNDDLADRANTTGAKAVTDIADLPDGLDPRLIFLAVKPNMVPKVLEDAAHFAAKGATYVSVAAGVTIDTMAAALPDGAAIIRCMPNTPASIGAGMMALYAAPAAPQAARDLTEKLLAASGAVTWIDDEALMDAVTAISGSGPAYVFHFIEALTAAGVALGLDRDTSELLAKQTVAGAGEMALRSDDTPATLRENVTSPGGTTAAALKVFREDDHLMRLVAEATEAARDRGVELGKGD